MTHAGAGAASTVAIGEAENNLAAATLAALSLSLQLKLKWLLLPNSAAVVDTAVMRTDQMLFAARRR